MSDIRQDAVSIMRLYKLVFSIHAVHNNKEAMKDLLDNAGKALKYFQKQEAYAIYYNIVSDYYDILLNGSYDTKKPNEELLLNKMLDAIEKTLRYSKRKLYFDVDHLYAENILAKAVILMRSGRGTKKEVGDLIKNAKKTIEENTSQYADVRLHCYLVYAWYFALMLDNEALADIFIKKAHELSDVITPTDLQKIEDVITPCANIFFELRCYDKSMDLLYEGTRLCAKHPNTDSYVRIKQKLCEHLWEVGINAQQFEQCQKIIEIIEAENKEIVDPKNRVVIPNEVRSVITNKTT